MSRLIFISYSHEDFETAARVAAELLARGLRVWQDVKDIRLGKRIESEMEEGIARSDAVLHLLTEDSITSPAVKREIELSTARRRRLADGEEFSVLIAARGLGDGLADVGQRTLKVFGENFARDWLEVLPPGIGPVGITDAGAFARKVLRSFYPRGTERNDGWRFGLHTRAFVGDGHDLELDWRSILDSEDGRSPGDCDGWQRCWRAVRDVRDVLADHSPSRAIELDAAAHQTAAMLFGLAFCRNGRYCLQISTQDGEPWRTGQEGPGIEGFLINLQPEDLEGTYLTVEIELARRVINAVSAQIAASGEEPRARILISSPNARLSPETGARLAVQLAQQTKQAVDERGVARVEIYPAAPLAFTTLFATELGALGTELALFEFHDGRYVPSIAIPQEER
jgi:hypothetical protein